MPLDVSHSMIYLDPDFAKRYPYETAEHEKGGLCLWDFP